MADETTATATTPQETATVPVTDADLSSAFDASQTEQTTETTQTDAEKAEAQRVTEALATASEAERLAAETGETHEEGAEEPTDNAERSRLGRRLKTIEEKFDQMLAKLGAPTETAVAATPAIPENVTYNDAFIQTEIDKAVEAGTLPATIMTPHDQYRVNQFVNGLQQYIGNQYAVRYLNTLKTPDLKGNTPDDIHAETVAELQKVESPFNLRRYDNPTLDAKMNYLEAKNAVLQKRLTTGTPTTVFKGKPTGVATGTSVSTRTTAVANDLPSLDEASQDFIKRTGMSVESVNNALKGDMPYNLRGGMR